MLDQNDLDKMHDIAKEIRDAYAREELFGIRHENGKAKDFAHGDWTFNNLMAESLLGMNLDEKLQVLERCPRYSLFYDDKRNHWMVFLGCKNNDMYFYDSYLHDRLRILSKITVAKLTISVLLK